MSTVSLIQQQPQTRFMAIVPYNMSELLPDSQKKLSSPCCQYRCGYHLLIFPICHEPPYLDVDYWTSQVYINYPLSCYLWPTCIMYI